MSDQSKYLNKLADHRVLLIGGTSGIGFAVAEACLEYGCTVIVSSSNQARIDSAVKRLQTAYPSKSAKVSGYPCNLGDESKMEDQVLSLLNFATKDSAEPLHHIVYTAGSALKVMSFADASVEDIRAAGTVRFMGAMVLAKHAPKFMHAGPASSITLTTGSVSQKPMKNWALPGSWSGTQHTMARSLALDLAPIRVNTISPGAVKTELWESFGMSSEQIEGMLKQTAQKMATAVVPGPEEVAEAYLYVMKDRNVTGEIVSTNGGSLLM